MSRRSLRALSVSSPLRSSMMPPLHEVGRRVDEHAFGFETVAAGTARFLLIVLERLWRAGVHDEADVGAVDPHAEGDGRDDDVDLFVEEEILVAAAFAVVQPGVIRAGADARFGEPGGERFDLAARRAVDDPALALVAGEDVLQLLLQAVPRQHAIEQIRPIEGAHELDRVLEREL